MSTVVFVGPTLPAEQVSELLPGAQVLGPAGCGDIHAATRAGATAIVLIDGYFEQRLPVWHKEVLWALSKGVLVYGAASMGALRAAELHRFGMIGVGRIFDWYLSGTIEADDEVAIAHEAAERGYRPVSEAMVNLRATFLAAEKAGIIRSDTCAKLIAIGRSIFYPSRSYREVLSRAAHDEVEAAELGFLRDWLSSSVDHIVDQKRADARAVLERVRTDLADNRIVAPHVAYSFSYTEVWHELTRQVAARAHTPPLQEHSPRAREARTDDSSSRADQWTERVLKALDAIDPRITAGLRSDAASRAVLLGYVARESLEAEAAAVQDTSDEFRLQRDLLTPQRTKLWLSERELDVAEFSGWMEEELLLAKASELLAPSSLTQLRRVLHASKDPVVLRVIAETHQPEVSTE